MEDKTENSVHDPKGQSEKAHYKMVSRYYEIPKQIYGLWIIVNIFWRGEASFWAIENYTGRVHFEGHSPEWRVL